MESVRIRKQIIPLLLLSLLIFFGSISSAYAATYYVAGDTGSDSYTSTQAQDTATPWLTIQKAADTMVAGDTVNVKGGLVYAANNNCESARAVICLTRSGEVNNDIQYQPWSGTGSPVIDGAGSTKGFSFTSNSSCISHISINGFVIKNSTYAIELGGAGNIVSNNIVYDQERGDSSFTLGIYSHTYYCAPDISIYNNTIYNKYLGVHIDGGDAIIKNNILYGNVDGIGVNSSNINNVTIDYNDAFNSVSANYSTALLPRGGHDLELDPQFENISTFDFHLKSTSPLVDAGTAIPIASSDNEGNTRPRGNAYDIGAYESSFSQSPPPNASAHLPSYVGTLTLLSTYTGESAGDQFSISGSMQIGDVDEDGYEDILIGGRYHSYGGVYIFKGKTNLNDMNAGSADIILRDTTTTTALGGYNLLGDINGDNHLDILAGNYRYRAGLPGDHTGNIFFFETGPSFSSRNTAQSSGMVVGPINVNARFGIYGSILGDINHDGFNDYIFGSAIDNKAYFFWGERDLSNKSVTQANVVITNDIGNYSITFAKGSGDINGDGQNDLVLICSYCNTYRRAIYIIYGKSDIMSKNLSQADAIITGVSNTSIGYGGTTIADFNRDGFADILTGCNTGACIFSGGSGFSTRTTASADERITLADPDFSYLSNATALWSTNINNDEYPDIVISNSAPKIFILLGAPQFSDRTIASSDLVFYGTQMYGQSLGDGFAAGDVNKDGYAELLVNGFTYNDFQGRAYLLGVPHGTPQMHFTTTGYARGDGVLGTITDTVAIGGVDVSYDGGMWRACVLVSGKFSCPISSLAEGSHATRVRSYTSLGIYMPTAQYVSTTFVLDTIKPTIKITKLGLINDIPDRTNLSYYFTSQTPYIQGEATTGSVVHFKFEGQTYSATANGAGAFGITLASPKLPRNKVKLTYYAQDAAGNKSETRTLNLIIGTENFPATGASEQGTSPTTGDVALLPIVPATTKYSVESMGGIPLPGAEVTIDGQLFVADELGKVFVEKMSEQPVNITVKNGGETLAGKILGNKIVVGAISTTPTVQQGKVSRDNRNLIYKGGLVLILVGGTGAGLYFLKKRKYLNTS